MYFLKISNKKLVLTTCKPLLVLLLCGLNSLSAQVIIIEVDIPAQGAGEGQEEGDEILSVPEVQISASSSVMPYPSCTVYPNPVRDKMTIEFREHVDLQRIRLINENGFTIFDAATGWPYANMTADGVLPGNYNLFPETDYGTISTSIQVVD